MSAVNHLVIARGGGIVAFGVGEDIERAKEGCEANCANLFSGEVTAMVYSSDVPGRWTWDYQNVNDPAGEPATCIGYHRFTPRPLDEPG